MAFAGSVVLISIPLENENELERQFFALIKKPSLRYGRIWFFCLDGPLRTKGVCGIVARSSTLIL